MGLLHIRMTAQRRKEIQQDLKANQKEIAKVKIVNGKKRVSGGKHLKETQQYPRGFGVKVSKLHSTWVDTWRASKNIITNLAEPDYVYILKYQLLNLP